MVVGAGASGLAAAVTAARQGARVLVLERYGFCGGGAVAGLSGTICGMYLAHDDPEAGPQKVVFGFLDEFISRMEARGGLTPPVPYGKTYTRVHDPLKWRETADDLLQDAKVDILYHAVVTGTFVSNDGAFEGVSAWTKQGPLAVRAKVTVDASGDADVCAMAGLPEFIGRDGNVQNPTMIFRLGGVDIGRFRSAYGADTIMPLSVSRMIEDERAAGNDLPRSKIWLFETPQPNELLCNCTRIVGDDGRELNTLFRRDFSDAESMGRSQARRYADFFVRNLTGCENAYLIDTAPQVGVRQTRQVSARYVLKNSDVTSGRKFDTGIARSPWPIELHKGAKPRVEWLIDDYYEVPFDCFVPVEGENILTAGRCLSAEHEAVASARVTAQCFSYGEAIGHAAAISALRDVHTTKIDPADIRTLLTGMAK